MVARGGCVNIESDVHMVLSHGLLDVDVDILAVVSAFHPHF